MEVAIKAIETRYKGCRFRSRLEARWAVFFDAIKVQWEYEPEGFILDTRNHYLPDFWIPAWQSFVEIKPAGDSGGWRSDNFCNLLSHASGHRVLMFIGSPWPEGLLIREYRGFKDEYGQDRWNEFDCIAGCRRCDGFCLMSGNNLSDIGPHSCKPHDKWPASDSLIEAYTAARSSRFEHGESP